MACQQPNDLKEQPPTYQAATAYPPERPPTYQIATEYPQQQHQYRAPPPQYGTVPGQPLPQGQPGNQLWQMQQYPAQENQYQPQQQMSHQQHQQQMQNQQPQQQMQNQQPQQQMHHQQQATLAHREGPFPLTHGMLSGKLEVKILDAKYENRFFTEPYVIIRTAAGQGHTVIYKGGDKNDAGKWYEKFEFFVDGPTTIALELYDESTFGRDNFLGSCTIQLNTAEDCGIGTRSYNLSHKGKHFGTLNAEITLWPVDKAALEKDRRDKQAKKDRDSQKAQAKKQQKLMQRQAASQAGLRIGATVATSVATGLALGAIRRSFRRR